MADESEFDEMDLDDVVKIPANIEVAQEVLGMLFNIEVPDMEFTTRRALSDEEEVLKSAAISVLIKYMNTEPAPPPKRRKKPKQTGGNDGEKATA